jgi:hypothetical protein
MPMLGCFRTKCTDSECIELYINKLFRLTSEETQRLAYSYRDVLMTEKDKHTLAHRAMLSVLQIRKIISKVSWMSRDKTVIRCGCPDGSGRWDALRAEASTYLWASKGTLNLQPGDTNWINQFSAVKFTQHEIIFAWN